MANRSDNKLSLRPWQFPDKNVFLQKMKPSYSTISKIKKWNEENNVENRKYMLNAYRVLLTRARQGIVICVPEGNSRLNSEGFPEDPTRLPEFYDSTYQYLKSIGIKEI